MALKYQHEIDKKGLEIKCPITSDVLHDFTAYRWVTNPISNADNFLPNILFNELRGIPPHRADATHREICLRCGISLMDSAANARKIWGKLPPKVQQNFGYTDIAEGVLDKDDGYVFIEDIAHFSFYENEKEKELFKNKFEIVDTLQNAVGNK